MKKQTILSLLLFLSVGSSAQNVIIKTNGQQLAVKILSYGSDSIKYTPSLDPELYAEHYIRLDSVKYFTEPNKKSLKHLSRAYPRYAKLNNTCKAESKEDSLLVKELEEVRAGIRNKIENCPICNVKKEDLKEGIYPTPTDFYNKKIVDIGSFTLEPHSLLTADYIELYKLKGNDDKKITLQKLSKDQIFAIVYENEVYIMVEEKLGGGLIFSKMKNYGRFWLYHFYYVHRNGYSYGGTVRETDNILDIIDLSRNDLTNFKDFHKIISDDIYLSAEFELTRKAIKNLPSYLKRYNDKLFNK